MDLERAFKDSGAESEDLVPVDISYDIIRHVSTQLYTSPRKAIEELICNSYDAGATECHVGLPASPGSPLRVLDNGESMDLSGLHSLWQVAHSPKSENLEGFREANGRLQIGKFGVGKLAAFALGGTLTYIACVRKDVRVISVSQGKIKGKTAAQPPKFPVLKLSKAKARKLLDPVLADLPSPWSHDWGSWTLALVDDIDQGAIGEALKVGILRRMITTALPVSAQFRVFLDGDLVPKRAIDPKSIEVKVSVLDQAFRRYLETALREYWADLTAEAPDDVPERDYRLTVGASPDPESSAKTRRALLVPHLGPVIGDAISTTTSLTTEKLHERGYYNNGFAITCFGKLINPEDPLFGITQRSHKYWNKFLARVEIPGLDRVLLVQRNAVSENSIEAKITRELLRSLFNYTRSLVEDREGEGPVYQPGSLGERLGTSAPILAQAAIKGLLHGAVSPGDLAKLSIEFATLGVDGPAARFEAPRMRILINDDHPLPTSLDDLGALSKQMRRVMGEVLAGIELAKGYLHARGVAATIIDDMNAVMDAALRSAAEFVRDAVEEHIQQIYEASFEGRREFEKAVVEAFRSLGLAARHLGASDQPDGIIAIPRAGQENCRIAVEAKGSKGIITHKDLSESTASRHRIEHKCQHAIAIAREFAVAGRGGRRSALLRETEPELPLFTVEAITQMLRLHKRRNFTYDKVTKILTTWRSPEETESFINAVWKEIPATGLMRLILTVAHELVERDATNRPDAGMILSDERVRNKKIKKEDVIRVLESVELTTRMLTIVDPRDHTFELNAPVETILDAMKADFDAEGPSN